MTNLDVLGYLDEIPVCVAYEFNGERVDNFPVTPKLATVQADLRQAAGLEVRYPRHQEL